MVTPSGQFWVVLGSPSGQFWVVLGSPSGQFWVGYYHYVNNNTKLFVITYLQSKVCEL